MSINRIRQIKPDFFEDEKIATVSRDARLFFVGLWCRMDKNGIVEDTPRILKNLVYPLDEDITSLVIGDFIDELCNTGLNKENPGAPLLVRVKSGHKRYLFAPSFKTHQSVNHRERIIHPVSLDILKFTIEDIVRRGVVPSPNPGNAGSVPVHNGLWIMVYGIWVMGYGCSAPENVDSSVENVENSDATQMPPDTKKKIDKLLGRTQ